jgi:hypothetical protein
VIELTRHSADSRHGNAGQLANIASAKAKCLSNHSIENAPAAGRFAGGISHPRAHSAG